jgi:ribosomal protein S18 acetylase RimI-like enzyme
VATLPDHRRRGYSEHVVRALLAAGAARGVRDAWLQVLASNSGAIALYSRVGFTEAGRYSYLVGRLAVPPAAACRA